MKTVIIFEVEFEWTRLSFIINEIDYEAKSLICSLTKKMYIRFGLKCSGIYDFD